MDDAAMTPIGWPEREIKPRRDATGGMILAEEFSDAPA